MKKISLFFLAQLLYAFVSPTELILAQSQFKVVGYLPTWSGYPSSVNNVQLTKITHLNIAFANPDANANLTGGGTTSDIATVVNAAHAKNVKVLMSIGGSGAPGANYKSAITNNQTTFVNNIVQYVVSNNLDGIDVDIEGDVLDGTTLTASQYQGFVTQLGSALKAQGKLMTAALAGWFAGYVTSTALSAFDFVNIMAYDSTGSWASAGEHSTYNFAVTNFNFWNSTKGVPAAKLTIGVPFYGYCWGTYKTANGDEMSYCSIITKYSGAENYDKIGSGSNLISYNGIPTIQKKTAYAVQHAGGIMIWELTEDCSGSKSLLTVIDSTIKSLSTAIYADAGTGNFTFSVYPNPADRETVIGYPVAQDGNTKITVYDIRGKEVMKVAEERQTTGMHQLKLNTSGLENGIYFIKATVSGKETTEKLIISKN